MASRNPQSLLTSFIRPAVRSSKLSCSSRNRRWYSIHADAASATKLAEIDPSKLSIQKTATPKDLLPPEELVFGRTFTGTAHACPGYASQESLTISCLDHMLSLEWTASQGWLPPRITPYQNLSLDPATCVFHYAFECFEGMKAYRDAKGNIRMFRPDMNMIRLNKSSARIALPTFDGEAFTSLIGELLKVDGRFIPT